MVDAVEVFARTGPILQLLVEAAGDLQPPVVLWSHQAPNHLQGALFQAVDYSGKTSDAISGGPVLLVWGQQKVLGTVRRSLTGFCIELHFPVEGVQIITSAGCAQHYGMVLKCVAFNIFWN